MERDQSFLALMFTKFAYTIEVAQATGRSTDYAQQEVFRQIKQLSPSNGGDIITGKGVTKSG